MSFRTHSSGDIPALCPLSAIDFTSRKNMLYLPACLPTCRQEILVFERHLIGRKVGIGLANRYIVP
ncbi:MAG: hypothetical protein E3K37_11965 [Candidatus Kuenenia sp.]|nr:hypothetical protein [Candidatus Kuenenia hertensis]